jgi:hypothetical protein
MPGGPADLIPGAVQADADGAVAPDCHHVIDQQNLYLLSHPCLFLSLTWRWRTGLARSGRISCSNTGRPRR